MYGYHKKVRLTRPASLIGIMENQFNKVIFLVAVYMPVFITIK